MKVFKKNDKKAKKAQFSKMKKNDLKKIKGGGDAEPAVEEIEIAYESFSMELI